MLKFSILFSCFLFFGCHVSDQKYQYYKPDTCLNDTLVTQQFVDFLNRSVPEYQDYWGEKFFFDKKNCFLRRAYIHDLSDSKPHNNMKKFIFQYGHVYHFYALVDHLSFSHIAYIDKKGKITFFESINCKDRGNSLSDVLNFINKELSDNKEKKDVLNKVKNYRKYMILAKIDNIKVKLSCDCNPCD